MTSVHLVPSVPVSSTVATPRPSSTATTRAVPGYAFRPRQTVHVANTVPPNANTE